MIKNNRGQSTIEFILTFSATIGFIFLFVKMSINYTNGFMVHHATYMASRSFLVIDSNDDKPEDGDIKAFNSAKLVFKKYLPEAILAGLELKSNNPGVAGHLPVFTGVFTEFTQRFSSGHIGGRGEITYRSESFLGREPTRSESYTQTCQAIKTVTKKSCATLNTLDDNGG